MFGFGHQGGSGFGSSQAGSFQFQTNNNFGSSMSVEPTGKSNTSGFGEVQNSFGFAQREFDASNRPPQANQQQTMFGSSPNVVTNTAGFSSSGGGFKVRGNVAIHANSAGFGVSSQHSLSSPFHGGAGSASSTSHLRGQNYAAHVPNPFSSSRNDDQADGLTFGSSSNVVRAVASSTTSFVPSGGWVKSAATALDSSAEKHGPSYGVQTGSFHTRPFGGTSEQNRGVREGGANPFQSVSIASDSSSSMQKQKHQREPTSRLTEKAGSTSRSVSSDSRGSHQAHSNDDRVDISLDEQAQRLKAKMEERKLLQEKIEEKKRRLLEKKKKQSNRSALNADAPSFFPGAKETKNEPADSEHVKQQQAVREGKPAFRKWQGDERSSKMRDLLPFEIQPTANAQDNLNARNEREDLKNAVALVGTCLHMCPDDELLRRERENDIQLLEIPMPGTLHPKDWTLRNTMIKRFRRSAADYKLDVPEWVRPPDVLERVCGYLEEWVMDRDRQGPDPRFPRQQAPQPLDVYQFIWNRTRMIRKDFTLQNYVGSGGQCDARAVRCHERIARWHAMCEHQLSHIPEFTKMQSQQNIQELGQTMKTLNQFYDDDLNRSIVEVPDEFGIETRADLSPYSHGCSADSVQGACPTDFDGSILDNESSGAKVAKRLIGRHAVHSRNHGTAEAEMRGLYILLTINNDGGMEVLKYAARLFKERPSIYHSKPVQLALDIYKAKKEYNYVRFFQILKSPTTPYLFGCIMFKYVELMRKVAIRIMSKTYGTRRKDTGENSYDGYPLKRFRDLLCYEDDNEARNACKHYNITVKAMKVKSSESSTVVMEFIFWRKSDFKEPVHPEKGFKLPLHPRKMIKTIESKHLGATRLGICRGEASGGTEAPPAPDSKMDSESEEGNSTCFNALQNISKIDGIREDSESRPLLCKTESSKIDNMEARGGVAYARTVQYEGTLGGLVEDEKHSDESVAIQRNTRMLAEAARMAEEEQIKLREERHRKDREKEARRMLEIETRRKLSEESRKMLEFETQQRLQIEAQRKIEVEERKKWERELLRRKQEEELAEERRRVEEEMQRMKAESEARRLAAVAKAMELQKLKNAEENRRKQMQRDLIISSRKKLLLARWDRRLSRNLESISSSRHDLQSIDPTFVKGTLHLESFAPNLLDREACSRSKEEVTIQGTRSVLESLLRHGVKEKINLSQLVSKEIATVPSTEPRHAPKNSSCKRKTILLKLGILFQSACVVDDVAELIRLWISATLETGKIHISEGVFWRVQSIAVMCKDDFSISDCDLVLCIAPLIERNMFELPENQSAVLCLNQYADGVAFVENQVPIIYAETMSVEAFQTALLSACTRLTRMFLRKPCFSIERMHRFSVATQAIVTSLWIPLSIETCSDDAIIRRAKAALSALSEEVAYRLDERRADWQTWPPKEFISSTGMVCDYFSRAEGLPIYWADSLDQLNVEVLRLLRIFDSPLRDVVTGLLNRDAPLKLKDDCLSMLSRRQFRGCLEKALRWRERQMLLASSKYVYFPSGLEELVMDGIDSRLSKLYPATSTGSRNCNAPSLQTETSLLTAIDFQLPAENHDSSVNGKPRSKGDDLEVVSKSESIHARDEPDKWKKRESGSIKLQDDSPFSRRKRTRLDSSHRVLESSAFSKRLESLLDGETVDMQIGKTTLTEILAKQKNSLNVVLNQTTK